MNHTSNQEVAVSLLEIKKRTSAAEAKAGRSDGSTKP
jgi:hypothetical protein